MYTVTIASYCTSGDLQKAVSQNSKTPHVWRTSQKVCKERQKEKEVGEIPVCEKRNSNLLKQSELEENNLSKNQCLEGQSTLSEILP